MKVVQPLPSTSSQTSRHIAYGLHDIAQTRSEEREQECSFELLAQLLRQGDHDERSRSIRDDYHF